MSPLNITSYMWWDLFPLSGLVKHKPEHPDSAALDQAIIAVLRRILTFDSIVCQESALFGLAYRRMSNPEIWEDIDEFIEQHPDLWESFNPKVRKAVFGEE